MQSEGQTPDEEKLNSQVHLIAKEYSIQNKPIDDLKDYYSFCVVREPVGRLASAFLDKFVQSKVLPDYAISLCRETRPEIDILDWTFADFVNALITSDVASFNEHWMPQHLHLIDDLYYELIPIEDVATHPQLLSLFGPLSSNVRTHSLLYKDFDQSEDFADAVKVGDLKSQFRTNKTVPSPETLASPYVRDLIGQLYEVDIALYEEARTRTGGQADFTIRNIGATTLDTSDSNSTKGVEPRLDDPPPISVILPVYNVEDYIEECLESLLKQSDPDFELVVVDDGSQDGSMDVVRRFADRFSKLCIYSQPNSGLGAARNVGIEKSNGEFVVFVDSDDFVSPDFISTLRRNQIEGDFDVVTGRIGLVSELGDALPLHTMAADHELTPPLSTYEMVLGGFDYAVSCARLYRRSLLQQPQISFPARIPHEDLFFTYKVLRRAARLSTTENTIYSWRQRSNSLSKSVTGSHLEASDELRTDMYSYLLNQQASDREFALAARRHILFLNNLWQKAAKQEGEVFDLYLRSIEDRRAAILDDYSRVRNSELSGLSLPDRTRKHLLSDESLKPTDQIGVVSNRSVIDFAFFPLRAYHYHACVGAVDWLRKQGFTCEIIESDAFRRGNNEVLKAAENSTQIESFWELIESGTQVRSVVLFNDWDPLMRILVDACRKARITTIGWVEGVQDYDDVDTRERSPYRRCEHLILPGQFDERYFARSQQRIHIGSVPRIQELWESRDEEPKVHTSNKILINSNFSYGVLEEHRDYWVTEAVKACRHAGFEPVLSRHPFDKGTAFSQYETDLNFYDAISECEASIQRFGSGVMESLALGIPVIYFNPHGEGVDKYFEPNGAYILSASPLELRNTLRFRRFFLGKWKRQVILNSSRGSFGQKNKLCRTGWANSYTNARV